MARKQVFVFGSNLAGRHGKGAALYAVKHCGAVLGQGEGFQGDSYAIPTKDANLRTLPLDTIAKHVETFKAFAASRPDLSFQITPVGCGLAGCAVGDIAPMFMDLPGNCDLPIQFAEVLAKYMVG